MKLLYARLNAGKWLETLEWGKKRGYPVKEHLLFIVDDRKMTVINQASSKEELMINVDLILPGASYRFEPYVMPENGFDPDMYGFDDCQVLKDDDGEVEICQDEEMKESLSILH